MARRKNKGILLTPLLILAAIVACDPFSDSGKKLVILGVDGMDPNLLERFIAEGKMPNFKKLAEEGSFQRLGTSNPPQSPVAWSCFITGMDPGGHGVFDFIHRDPVGEHGPTAIGSTQTTPAMNFWPLPGDYQMPSPFDEEPLPIRQGRAFWEMLEDEGIRAAVYRMPAAYPIQPTQQVTFTDMGTPDLQGGDFYAYYSTEIPEKLMGKEENMNPVTVDDGAIYTSLRGPPKLFVAGEPIARTPFTVFLDPQEPAVLIEIDGGASLVLEQGQWSDWFEVFYDLGMGQSVGGICRFYLKEVRPTFKMYVSPINIDPLAPAFPISTPDDAAVDVAEEIGRFYSMGLAEDVNALKDGVLDDGEFLQQCEIVNDERLKMLDYALDRFDDGLLFFYLSTIDLRSHMMFRHITPGHPARTEEEAEKYALAIESSYRKVDETLGHIRERIGESTELLVISDHGFSPFTRRVHLHNWLLQEGYLNLRVEVSDTDRNLAEADAGTGAPKIDWSRTRAYAAGFNGIYLNVAGREKNGIVDPQERDALMTEIVQRLEGMKDVERDGAKVVRKVYKREEAYHGNMVEHAPDLIVGYEGSYGASDPAALLSAPNPDDPLIFDNISKWSGNHLMDPTVVPGVLLATREITKADPWLADITATLLKYFEVDIPESVVGQPIF
jgi:predicted AlkP superfamily phosphohydrolase/phosphomutase